MADQEKIRLLPTLIAWLETMPADQNYNSCNSDTCLLAQYYSAHGHAPLRWTNEYPTEFLDVALVLPSTFGAALERARNIRTA